MTFPIRSWSFGGGAWFKSRQRNGIPTRPFARGRPSLLRRLSRSSEIERADSDAGPLEFV